MNYKIKKGYLLVTAALIWMQAFHYIPIASAQIAVETDIKKVVPEQIMPDVNSTVNLYLDQTNGMTADEAVRLALQNNGEILAMRSEIQASQALIKQAGLRPNPKIQINGGQQIVGKRNNVMVSAGIPLELGGRRSARIAVAEKEFAVRENMLAERERIIAAEVREKFGESLAQIKKLELVELFLANVRQGYELIAAKVTEGSTPPLEQNMTLVEVNRLRSMRENEAGNVEVKLLELRNIIGLEPTDPLRLQGEFNNLIVQFPPLDVAIEQAIKQRPDLQAIRATQELAESRLEQERSAGRIDASVMAGYQRMTSVMPEIVNTNPVTLQKRAMGENYLTLGVEIEFPFKNKNQGAIEAAAFEIQAAQNRVQFGKLTVRREVTAAYARYDRAIRSLTIFRAGVRDQAGQNLKIVWQTYELGSKTLLDYIAEERRYLDIETNLIDAELEAYQAKTEILRVTNAPELKNK